MGTKWRTSWLVVLLFFFLSFFCCFQEVKREKGSRQKGEGNGIEGIQFTPYLCLRDDSLPFLYVFMVLVYSLFQFSKCQFTLCSCLQNVSVFHVFVCRTGENGPCFFFRKEEGRGNKAEREGEDIKREVTSFPVCFTFTFIQLERDGWPEKRRRCMYPRFLSFPCPSFVPSLEPRRKGKRLSTARVFHLLFFARKGKAGEGKGRCMLLRFLLLYFSLPPFFFIQGKGRTSNPLFRFLSFNIFFQLVSLFHC